jgi:hypothetical protein
MRLQNLEQLNLQRLQALASRAGKPKWLRAAGRISALIKDEEATYKNG